MSAPPTGQAALQPMSEAENETEASPGAGSVAGAAQPKLAKLAWGLPELDNPKYVEVKSSDETVRLSPEQDYVVRFPSSPLVGRGGLAITGGHNVVIVGGEIDIPYQGAEPGGPCCQYGRGLLLSEQTGTVHVEGLYLHGEDLNEGIDLDEPDGAVVELEDIRIEDVHARDPNPETGIPPDIHPDLLQSWAGPRRLLIDGLSGSTDYQGIFLSPDKYVPAEPEYALFSNIDITGLGDSAFLLWRDTKPWPLYSEEVWLAPRPGRPACATFWPTEAAWPGVHLGVPPGGEFVPAGTAGTNYRSPGYE